MIKLRRFWLRKCYFRVFAVNPIQTGVGGVWCHTDLNPLLLTNDCFYSVPTSWLFLKFTWKQFGVVRFWLLINLLPWQPNSWALILDCKQCQIWKCNNWCHQTQHVWLGTPERENKGRKTRRSFSLFIWNYQIKIKQWFREFNKLFSDI